MRKQIAAANWKMNLSYEKGEELLTAVLDAGIRLSENQEVIFAVPFPYLEMAIGKLEGKINYFAAAQNCAEKVSGAYTGEVSAEMLQSLGIRYCIIGHSERREYFQEGNRALAEKLNRCLENGITPVFCCGEPLEIREKNTQNRFVESQLAESLFHLDQDNIRKIVIAYEPIWAIGTGKTASTAQAQEMHAYLRSTLAGQYGTAIADGIPILYGGSVKAGNAGELFASPDVDGGLVGGASLVAADFIAIIRSLRQ